MVSITMQISFVGVLYFQNINVTLMCIANFENVRVFGKLRRKLSEKPIPQ